MQLGPEWILKKYTQSTKGDRETIYISNRRTKQRSSKKQIFQEATDGDENHFIGWTF